MKNYHKEIFSKQVSVPSGYTHSCLKSVSKTQKFSA